MATSYFGGKPPKRFSIAVTRGCDRVFTIRRRDAAGALAAWGGEVFMVVDVDRSNPTVVDATVDGSDAVIVLESALLDLVKNSTRWRIVLSESGVETALAVGMFERADG